MGYNIKDFVAKVISFSDDAKALEWISSNNITFGKKDGLRIVSSDPVGKLLLSVITACIYALNEEGMLNISEGNK